jgi:hypothetical protein
LPNLKRKKTHLPKNIHIKCANEIIIYSGRRRKIIIHIPVNVKQQKHTHTLVKPVHVHHKPTVIKEEKVIKQEIHKPVHITKEIHITKPVEVHHEKHEYKPVEIKHEYEPEIKHEYKPVEIKHKYQPEIKHEYKPFEHEFKPEIKHEFKHPVYREEISHEHLHHHYKVNQNYCKPLTHRAQHSFTFVYSTLILMFPTLQATILAKNTALIFSSRVLIHKPTN